MEFDVEIRRYEHDFHIAGWNHPGYFKSRDL